MALSTSSVPIRVRALLASRGQDVSNLRNPRILALVPSALRMLAQSVMKSLDPAKRNLLRKQFDITSTDGVVDLTSHLAAAEPLLLEGIRQATITFDGETYPAQFKADRSSLSFPSSAEFVYWTLEGTKLLVVGQDGLGTYDNDGEIRNAPYVPILTNAQVQANLDAELIEIIAGLASNAKAA